MHDMTDFINDAVEFINSVEKQAKDTLIVNDPRLPNMDGRACAYELASRRLHALALNTDLIKQGETCDMQTQLMSEADILSGVLQIGELY